MHKRARALAVPFPQGTQRRLCGPSQQLRDTGGGHQDPPVDMWPERQQEESGKGGGHDRT